MALPTNLSAKLKAVPMDPVALATDLELAYTLSFSQHTISHDSIYVYPRDMTQSPLEQYQFANFDDHTYEQLLEETIKNYKHRNKQLVKGMRCGFKQFYSRVASTTFNTAIKFVSKQRNAGQKKLTLAKQEEEEYRIEKLKGNNPTKWPESTKEFVKDVNNLPWYAFSTDSELMFLEFVESAKNAIINLCHRSKSVEGKLQNTFKQNLLLEIEALLGVILRTNSQTFILQHLRFISELHRYLQIDPQSEVQICKRISTVFDDFFKLIPKESSQQYHYPDTQWNKDPFVIMKKIHFQKYAGLCYYSIATDGDFLYIYVSAVNGGMFKVGTGNNNTKAGKVYLEKQVHSQIGTKVDEVNWVYLKGKLYLKASSRDPWILQVIDPNTFKKEGTVQLYCPSLFGQQSLINLNKNSPLLTDGKNIYYLGTRLKICKNQQEHQSVQNKQSKSPQKQSQDKKQLDQKKKNLKKKAGKKNQQNEVPAQDQKNQNYQKILEIVLVEFSVDREKSYIYEGIDQTAITNLVDTFNGCYTRQECIRALVLNNYDQGEAIQWLFNQAHNQKDKNIKILDRIDLTILAQCQITSNFQEKAIKGPSEITTKDGSVLTIFNIFESIWTMDRQHVTCYSQTGAKVFSKNKKDFKKNPDTKLSNTLLKVYQNKYPKTPEFNIIYDPYNLIFYNYYWPQDGHYFPTTVLVSNDKKFSQRTSQQQSELTTLNYKLTSLLDIKKLALWYMQTVDRNSIKTKYRFNDWLWYYGQRVIEVNTELNQADSDKKRLSNKRTKILTKLNKINQVQKIYEKNKAEFANKNKVVKHIVKLYPFQSEGTLKNYMTLSQTFKNINKSPEEVPLYIACLENWLSCSSSTHNSQIKRILAQLGQILQKLKESSPANRILINKFLLKQFYLFFPTIQGQIKFIVSLNESQLLEFIKCQLQDERKEREEITYQITKKENLIQKYETNKCEFTEIFKSQSTVNLNQNKNIQNFANLLFSDSIQIHQESIITKEKVDENAKKALTQYIQKQLLQSEAGNKFIEALFFSAFKILNNNFKNHSNFFKYMSEVFVQIFSIYQKVLPKQRTVQLFNLLPTFLFIVEVYYGSQVSLHPNKKIINSLISIVQALQRPELNQIHSLIEDYEFEGISPITQKIYETSHPVERGKNYNFANKTYQNASYLMLDLDRRCQSDSNNDTLSVQMIHMDSPVGNNIIVNDGVFSSNLRLSGTVQTKKPYLIFGNAVTVDFNSSGHVKDTQSLVRYGFKFGLRPIFTGKLKLNDQKKQRIIKLFKSFNNFENYFNTLKFSTLAISNTIENYLIVQSESSQQKINKLLKGKIFKEGFEESAYKFDYSSFSPDLSLSSFLTKTEVESVDKLILKKNQEKYFTQNVQQLQKKQQKLQELWSFDGIPIYIQKYLQQIKDFKGDFIDVFTEARQLVKQKGTYAAMMKRKAVREHKTLWLQGEAILFLTILKHSGLLHLNLKFSIEYIKQNLKAFQEARDGIYNSFFFRIQYANEWRDLIQTYVGKDQPEQQKQQEKKQQKKVEQVKQPQVKTIAVKRKGPGKTVQIGSKVVEKKEEQKPASKKQKIEQKPKRKVMQKALFEKEVRQRLSSELIKGICNIKNIKYDENFQFDTVTTIIQQLIKASEDPLEPEEKAYKDPIQHLIKCCLFLLKFKSPSTKQSLTGHEQIVPVNISRSLSSDNRNVDANKLELFREWLQNWKNWKGFKKEGRVELQFPVQEIVKYINSWIDLESIYKAINKRYLKCQNRIQYYNYTQQLQKLLSQTKLVKYTLGSEVLNIHNEYLSGLQSINLTKLKELQQKYAEYKNNIKSIEVSYFDKLPLTLESLENNLKSGSTKFLQKIKLLGQIIFLLQSQNPEININMLLYFITFKYMSAQNDDLVFLSNSLIQKGLISPHSNEEIVEALSKQVGSNNINFKRWKDYFFIQRVLFLLKKMEINMRQKKNIVFQTQQKIAESIFYLLYHVEIPLISRLGLKILKRLNISLKDGIRTPFDYEYKLYKQNEKNELLFKERFTLSRNSRNNITLLCSKINSIFNPEYVNELALKFGEIKDKEQSQVKYNIILNLHQEEDLYWLIKVLYYIDELEKKQGEKTIPEIKDFDQYLQLKNKKREGEKKQQQQNNPNQGQKDKNPFKQQEKNERIFNNIPKYTKIDSQLQKELPVGWFFNYCNIFADPLQKMNASSVGSKSMKSIPIANLQNAQKNPKNKNQNNNQNNPNNAQKKNWNTPIFTKLYKKYEEYNSKPPQQPKQTDSAEIKADYIKARNFFNRIRKYFIEITFIMDQFSRNGYYVFREDVSRVKMNQICQLITSGCTNKLKDISLQLKNNDIKNRLIVNDFAPNFNSKLQITIIKSTDFAYFDNLVSYQNALSNRSDTNNVYFTLLGKRQLSLEDAKSFMPYQEFIPLNEAVEDEDIQFGKQWIQSNFSKMKKKHEKVYLNDYPNDTFYIGQGGIQSGIKDNILVPANDSSLTLQTSTYEKIMTEPKVKSAEQYEQTEMPEELIEKVNKIIQKGSIHITKKSDIKEYLLLTFYLKKLKKCDLQFVDRAISKEFAQKLFRFSENLRSYKELEAYQEDIQKLIVKLIDNEHEKLHLFGTYIHDEDYDFDIQEYLIPVKLQKLNSSNEVKQDSIQTHSTIKSKYLLKSQPPQIEQNKLLKYWQKNILPRILDFVKTTLKPIEIEDFWQQMRRPLRVGDHTQAKRVAYIICDNKLPGGAVLPDANHNWNSLQIEQIFVGQNVLVKIPRNKSDFCTPLLGWGHNDQKLAKVVFIDLKNNSVLIRYRLQELAIFSYTWVPINCLMAVEKQVMHISTKSIYQELNKKLEGIIYIYAKDCLTKLASSVSDVDNIKLIKQTILDLFIKNPISGCFNFPKPVWSMRPIFEKMLQDGNFAIIDSLQKKFCSIKGIDLNLNSEKMIELNRFQDAKALIVSFKKDARLAVCSGVRFYNDKFGYNEVAHVYTAKNQKTDLEPLEFNQPNIYCKYYTNKECLPIVQQNNYKVYPIEATIFAVDEMWTIGCYLGEVACEIASSKNTINYLNILQRLNTIYLKWLSKKSVSVLCSHLSKLISKIALTIANICQKNNKEITLQILGTNLEQIKDTVGWINNILAEQSNQKVALYSALLQNLSEMVASLIVKTNVNLPNLPEHIKSSADLIKMFKEIDNFTKTKKMSLIIPSSQANYQWERILQISNIPRYFNEETVYNKIKDIIQQNKGKILCPKVDIYQKNGVCYVLVDGWDINELVQEQIMQKMEQEQIQEERQQEMNQAANLAQWECPACTFKNPHDVNMCQICETPAPVAAKQEEIYDQVQATDLKAAERKIKQRQAKRFEEVKIQILKFFEDQYKVVCDLVQKRNHQLQQQAKKDGKKHKKENDHLDELKQIPKKPQIKLETGSTVFQKENIDQFLKVRFEYFPAQLKKLVEDEQTYIGKFKKLLILGFDLWGDCITNQNATLVPFNHLYLLMDYIQTEICKGSSSVLSYSEESIRILSAIPLLDHKFDVEPVNYTSQNDMGVRVKYKALAGLKSYNIRYSWKLVKELNLAASKCLQFINMDLKFDKERNDTCPVYNDSLGYKIKYFRNLIMGVIKLELFQKIMQKTSVLREADQVPKVILERLKVKQGKNRTGLVTVKQKEDYLFTKSHDQFSKISHAYLRPFKPKGTDPYLSFTVTFKGQNVQGQAGPYRQFFTDIARELEPKNNLGLFIPTPNNKNQSGEHKSKWIINPKANSSYHFSLFEYIGTLMGCCFRTGSHLALDLPSMFWKSITHEEITDQDLQEVDQKIIKLIKILKDCPSKEIYESAMDQSYGDKLTWTYKGYDDQIHQMIYNGKNTPVQFEDIGKYIEMLKLKKINETKLQVKRIAQGISELIPLPYLHCLTGEELKLAICGRPKVDVQLLKKHTKYSGGLNEQSRRIKFFWEIMRELPEGERLKIIRFCWGQQRLPINSEEFQRNNTRFMIKPMIANKGNQDQALPRADTCFFNIQLPDYSTKAIMKEKILLAVNLDSVSINADEKQQDDNPLMNELDTYGQQDYQEGESQW